MSKEVFKNTFASLLVLGALVVNTPAAEASPPPPKGGPILPYQDPGVDYEGRVEIQPLPNKESGGQNDNNFLGRCGLVQMCQES